jgi:diguanylate cyclase (GGDEF)-like protein
LTGLRNRQFFDEKLKEEVVAARRYGRHVGLILLDVDHFKKCNDAHGHPFGDKVLQHVAETISNAIRESDWACRYGGEEFGVILPEADLEAAVATADRLHQAFQLLSLRHQGRQVEIRASLGVSSSSPCLGLQSLQVQELIETADQALYQAKRDGRNRLAVGAQLSSSAGPHNGEVTEFVEPTFIEYPIYGAQA